MDNHHSIQHTSEPEQMSEHISTLEDPDVWAVGAAGGIEVSWTKKTHQWHPKRCIHDTVI